MRIINLNEQRRANTNGIRIVEKFLKHLDGVSSVSRNTQGRYGADLSFTFGKENKVALQKEIFTSRFISCWITQIAKAK